MGVSLNNHEARIKALENGGSTIFVTPDYRNITNINVGSGPGPSGGTYTVSSNGFIICDLMSNSGSGIYLKVNNVMYHSGYDSRDEEVICTMVLPVVKNDVVSWNHAVWSGRSGIKFVPYKLTKLYYNLVYQFKEVLGL